MVRDQRWRSKLVCPTPPPTCEEPVFDQVPLRPPPPHQHASAAERAADADADADAALSLCHDGGADERDHASWHEGRASCPHMPEGGSFTPAFTPPAAVPWEGPRGGDAVLAAVIALLQPTQWLQECTRRADGKARMWQLVATHLPGRTPAEGQERWRCLSEATTRQRVSR